MGAITLIAVGNLRGLRESGRLFALPSYLFILGLLALLVVGFTRYVAEGAPEAAAAAAEPVAALTAFLVLRAFASGAVALTGIEAVADGVTAFKPPEVVNARAVLAALALIMTVLFVGTTALADLYDVIPRENETVVSQLARQVFGSGVIYYYIQGVSMLIQSRRQPAFADFPRLASSWPATATCPTVRQPPPGDRLGVLERRVMRTVVAAVLILSSR